MTKVTSYTYASVADNRPGFALTRPGFDESGVVRMKSNPSVKLAGVRESKNVAATLERERTRIRFGRGSYEYTQLSGDKLTSWQQAASAAGLETWQFYQGGVAWRRARGYGCAGVVPVSVYEFEAGNSFWEEAGVLG